MMKYIKQILITMILTLFCVVLLSACGLTKITYPLIEYRVSDSNFDIKNKTILLDGGYYLDDSNPYDMIDTESGYDLVIHFIKD